MLTRSHILARSGLFLCYRSDGSKDRTAREKESGTSFETFKQRYRGSIEEELWITKSRYRDYEKKRNIEYSGLPHGRSNESYEG